MVLVSTYLSPLQPPPGRHTASRHSSNHSPQLPHGDDTSSCSGSETSAVLRPSAIQNLQSVQNGSPPTSSKKVGPRRDRMTVRHGRPRESDQGSHSSKSKGSVIEIREIKVKRRSDQSRDRPKPLKRRTSDEVREADADRGKTRRSSDTTIRLNSSRASVHISDRSRPRERREAPEMPHTSAVRRSSSRHKVDREHTTLRSEKRRISEDDRESRDYRSVSRYVTNDPLSTCKAS